MSFSVISSGNLGDIIYSIPCCLALANKFNYYLEPYVLANYYDGCDHPCGRYRMDETTCNAVIPLLKSQTYIDECKIHSDEPIDVNLDYFRMVPKLDYLHGNIANWYGYVFNVSLNLTAQWLFVEAHGRAKDKIVFSRTKRYRNDAISYAFLNNYEPLFVGLKSEWDEIKQEVPSATWIETRDLLEVARLVAGCKLFIGNQSALFAIAEAMKVPRILEVCLFAQNVVPIGYGGHAFINQSAFQMLVERLNNI